MRYYMSFPHRYRRPHRYGYRPVQFNGGRRIPVDVHADEEGYTIRAMVPGLKAEDLQIEILDDVVTLHGELNQQEGGNGSVLLQEIPAASTFDRKLRMPDPLDPEKAKAKVEDGLLELRVPKAESARPKKIAVKPK